jgi:hypothetical protein
MIGRMSLRTAKFEALTRGVRHVLDYQSDAAWAGESSTTPVYEAEELPAGHVADIVMGWSRTRTQKLRAERQGSSVD